MEAEELEKIVDFISGRRLSVVDEVSCLLDGVPVIFDVF